MDYIERVMELIAENLDVPVEDLSEDTDIANDLDVDSLDLVELAMAIEDEFEIELDDDVVPTLRTVQDLAEEVKRLVEAK
ncbi:MAG: acyl carrier protein [Peptoniphilaceae bacterium]|nr:acyl carrier protein [Peptoniphilaceae bacterium]MDY6085450.1 acyl carrier protein [Peptoniphilaceae bacterium]